MKTIILLITAILFFTFVFSQNISDTSSLKFIDTATEKFDHGLSIAVYDTNGVVTYDYDPTAKKLYLRLYGVIGVYNIEHTYVGYYFIVEGDKIKYRRLDPKSLFQ